MDRLPPCPHVFFVGTIDLLCPLNCVFILLIKKHLILWLGTLKIYITFLLLDNLFSF
ncbi:hypothetical protein ZWY2020_048119, partial [Hordeum vulgare]